MKKIALIVLMIMSSAFSALAADEACYQVSPDGVRWSRTPETLCVSVGQDERAVITLKSGLPFRSQEVARFNLTLLLRARCMDCNKDVFGVANPENSTFNALSIKFDGLRDLSTGEESGKVSIGETTLYYRK